MDDFFPPGCLASKVKRWLPLTEKKEPDKPITFHSPIPSIHILFIFNSTYFPPALRFSSYSTLYVLASPSLRHTTYTGVSFSLLPCRGDMVPHGPQAE